jgi:very-short-patch-repair endonuclease
MAETSEKRKNTRIENYGSYHIGNSTSKESLRYFIKIYKKLRKNGFSKNDIVWGIAKRKEFHRSEKGSGKTYAFDFVIKSKRFIIEYNNPFWHAREDNKESWKNPYITYNGSLDSDKSKINFIENAGYKVLVVWSDNLPSVEEVYDKIIN